MAIVVDKANLLLPFRNNAPDNVVVLRVGIVLDYRGQASWANALQSLLMEVPGLEVQSLYLGGQPTATSRRPPWVTDRLYSVSRAKCDPYGGEFPGREGPPPADSLDRIRAAKCGILLWLASYQDPGIDLQELAKYGVFTVRFGAGNRIIPFWDEVANSELTSTTTIQWHQSSFARGRPVRIAETSTVPSLYLTLNAEEPLVAAVRTIAGLCLEMRHGPRFRDKLQALPEGATASLSTPTYPTNIESARFILRKLARSTRLRWEARKKRPKWFVAIRPNYGSSIVSDDGSEGTSNLEAFAEVPLPEDTDAMADPFLCEVAGRHYLFFEELPRYSYKGRISCLEIFPNGSYSARNIILERAYHVSYPCIVTVDSDVFLLPETSEAGCVDLYRFSRFPGQIELVARLVDGLRLVDTTPFFLDNLWYFFTTTASPFMETHLFCSTRIDGPWRLHPCSPISCSVRNSRSAGNLFWKAGRLYRPTQDCSARYGYAIRVNEVVRLTPTEFEERSVGRVLPTWRPGLLATHTWNESSSLQVLDGVRLDTAVPSPRFRDRSGVRYSI